jgi:hypothetical protein
MKKFLALLSLIVIAGCSDSNTVVVEDQRMIVSPTTLVFNSGETEKTISISHTCTCAFSWTCSVTPPNGVLKDTNGIGDTPTAVIRVVDRSKMTSDTLHTSIIVSNNSPIVYGIDTIAVTVIR